MKRTNVVVDENKVKELKRAYGLESTKEVLDFALSELLKAHRRKRIVEMQGRIHLDIDLDKTRKLR